MTRPYLFERSIRPVGTGMPGPEGQRRSRATVRFGHLVFATSPVSDVGVDQEDEPSLDWDTEDRIILLLMRLDAKLDEILRLLEEEDGEEETDA